uniref:GMC family oxidoreductase n=1 Tax=Rhizobium laguerreae TaxID=1076926 RepID=UPI0021B108C2
MKDAAYGRQFARTVFTRLGAQDHTHYDPSDFGYVAYEGQGYAIRGGNHLAGTHIMGTTKTNSVVDKNQRSWDHENLYLVGGGSMPIRYSQCHLDAGRHVLPKQSRHSEISALNKDQYPIRGTNCGTRRKRHEAGLCT